MTRRQASNTDGQCLWLCFLRHCILLSVSALSDASRSWSFTFIGLLLDPGIWHHEQHVRVLQRLHQLLYRSNLDGSDNHDGDAGHCVARRRDAPQYQYDGSL